MVAGCHVRVCVEVCLDASYRLILQSVSLIPCSVSLTVILKRFKQFPCFIHHFMSFTSSCSRILNMWKDQKLVFFVTSKHIRLLTNGTSVDKCFCLTKLSFSGFYIMTHKMLHNEVYHLIRYFLKYRQKRE